MPLVRVTGNYGADLGAEGIYSESGGVFSKGPYRFVWDGLDTWSFELNEVQFAIDDGSGDSSSPATSTWTGYLVEVIEGPGEIPTTGAGSPASPGQLPPSDGGGQVVTSPGSIDPQDAGTPPSSPGSAQPVSPSAPTPPENFVGTFAQTLTAAQQRQSRRNMVARKAGNGRFIDFDRADLFPDATEFSYGSVTWNDGVTPLRVSIDPEDGGDAADYQPYIENGGVRPADRSVVYLGGNVEKEGEVFSMGCDFTLNEGFPISVQSICLNVTFRNTRLQDESGIYPVGSAHFNLGYLGVNQASIFSTSGDLTAANRTKVGSADLWDENGEIRLESGKRYILLLRAWDDIVELTIKGVGTIIYQNAGFAALQGPDMHFWVEPFPATSKSGSQLTHYCTVHRVWAMDEARDSLPAKQNRILKMKQDITGVNGFPASLGSSDLFDIIVSADGSAEFPSPSFGKRSFYGGNIYLAGGKFVADSGIDNAAGARPTVAVMTLGSGITDELLSAAGGPSTLYTLEQMNWLWGSESETYEICGMLVGTNAKQLVIGMTVYTGNIIFDSNRDGTPLDAIEGPYRIRITRFHHDAMAYRYITEMLLPDGTFIIQEHSSNSGAGRNINNLEFRTTTADAGGIKLYGSIHNNQRPIIPTSP